MNISLTPEQLRQCEAAARQRQEDSQRRGCKDRRGFTLFQDFGLQVRSYAAELCVAAALCVAPQTGVGQINQPDLVLKDGTKIEVKSSNGDFLHVEPSRLQENFWYALVNVSGSNGSVRGFVRGSDIAKRNDLVDYSNGRPPVLRFPARLMVREPEQDCPF